MVAHCLAERDGRAKVVVVIFQRHMYRLAHGLEAGKMDDAVDLLLGKNAVESGAVAHVHLIELQGLARDLLDPSARLRAAVDEIVHHDDIHALLEQLHARVAADVAHAPYLPLAAVSFDCVPFHFTSERREVQRFSFARVLPCA